SDPAAFNPFGTPGATTFDPARKHALASRIDVAPLRELAVFHNGRVKIVETLAAETVRAITGRSAYADVVAGTTGRARRARYDPVFTLLDLCIDPQYYADKPLVHVEYFGLRQEIVEAAGQVGLPAFDDPGEREWWMRHRRLPPAVLMGLLPGLQSRMTDASRARALAITRTALELYQHSAANLDLVAPASPAGAWQHLSALDPDSPAGRATAELGRAWRAGDADAANAAIATLASALPAINPEHYPGARRGLEHVYNAARPFELGYWAYFLSLLSQLLAFGTSRRWLFRLAVVFLGLGLALHAGGFVARCVIAERFAIQNQFESMTGISLFAVLVATVLMAATRVRLFGAAGAAVGFMFLIWATQLGIPGKTIEREAAILNTSVLLKYHVTTVLVSYGLIALGFVTSLFYLLTHYTARFRAPGPTPPAGTDNAPAPALLDVSAAALGLDQAEPRGVRRVLADLDAAQMIVLQLAFWTLGVGILLGAWWADHSWGRWWAFDPKETWALVTWIVYLIVIHLRLTTAGNRALITAWLSILGFFVMLWTYFGVNLLLPGLHAYA
ncbi:MAG TPA: cytochrome c biogenesis protein CcsA, partial [Phycisphaerales bacterium]|nr:cytochrome c biogenesis protein CcsA [Phycisphaerales bacterium]